MSGTFTIDQPFGENHGVLIQHRPTLAPKKLLESLSAVYGPIASHATFEMTMRSDLLTAVFFSSSKKGESCFLDLRHIVDSVHREEAAASAAAVSAAAHPDSPLLLRAAAATGNTPPRSPLLAPNSPRSPSSPRSYTKHHLAITNIGWVHEQTFWSTWQSKPYIKGRYCQTPPMGPVASPTRVATDGQRSPQKSPVEGFLIVFWQKATTYQKMEIEMLGRERAMESWSDEKEGGRLFLHFASEDDALLFRDFTATKYPFLSRFVSFAEKEDFEKARPATPRTMTPPPGSPLSQTRRY